MADLSTIKKIVSIQHEKELIRQANDIIAQKLIGPDENNPIYYQKPMYLDVDHLVAEKIEALCDAASLPCHSVCTVWDDEEKVYYTNLQFAPTYRALLDLELSR